MPVFPVPGLSALPEFVLSDPGLAANIPLADIEQGAAAAELMNSVYAQALAATGVNTDGVLTPADVRILSDYIRANPALYAQFIEGHGNDEGNVETGYHLVQGDGGAYQFQGRNFINTIGDAIYHIGFVYNGDRFVNEDGDQNERVDDVAGWLNYFVNGENRVFGTNASETLNSGAFSFALAAAANEIFNAGGGDDRVWAGLGNDTVYGAAGNDRAGGGQGDDLIWGGTGHDSLGGDEGNDRMGGGTGDDRLQGEAGNDTLFGEAGADSLYGGVGNDSLGGGADNDRLIGGQGEDTLSGGTGQDWMIAQSGNDTIYAGEGHDRLFGGIGNDAMYGEEDNDFMRGEAGHDLMHGQDGNDRLAGGIGNDTMTGGDGNDLILGQFGNDSLRGGEGLDRIIGGAGVDEMADWEDTDVRDIFVFYAGDTGVGAGNRDVVHGFDSGIDQLDLSAFGPLSLGFGTSFSAQGSGELVFRDHLVRIDVNGDGTAEAEIELTHVNALSLSDFLLA